jgi:hypothetical protein
MAKYLTITVLGVLLAGCGTRIVDGMLKEWTCTETKYTDDGKVEFEEYKCDENGLPIKK